MRLSRLTPPHSADAYVLMVSVWLVCYVSVHLHAHVPHACTIFPFLFVLVSLSFHSLARFVYSVYCFTRTLYHPYPRFHVLFLLIGSSVVFDYMISS